MKKFSKEEFNRINEIVSSNNGIIIYKDEDDINIVANVNGNIIHFYIDGGRYCFCHKKFRHISFDWEVRAKSICYKRTVNKNASYLTEFNEFIDSLYNFIINRLVRVK